MVSSEFFSHDDIETLGRNRRVAAREKISDHPDFNGLSERVFSVGTTVLAELEKLPPEQRLLAYTHIIQGMTYQIMDAITNPEDYRDAIAELGKSGQLLETRAARLQANMQPIPFLDEDY